MTQNNLFEQGKTNEPVLDDNTDFFSELVGEGKKFKDQQALAKGKYQSDMYVKTLERKLDEMRADYDEAHKQNLARARLEELIDRLDSSKNSNSEAKPQAREEENTPQQFNLEDIDKRILNKIEDTKRQEKEQSNFNIVQQRLKERFGNNFANVLEQQKQVLGLDSEDINALARKSPTAFFRTLGLEQPAQQDGFQSPPRSQIRNDNFLPNVQKRTWSYYQDIKKKDKSLYNAPKTIAQMHRDHAELGREFEDGDYNN